MTDEPVSGLPPLDPDTGLLRRAWDAGDHIVVEVMTAGGGAGPECPARGAGSAFGVTSFADAPDEMHVAGDGRPIAVYFSARARQQRDAG